MRACVQCVRYLRDRKQGIRVRVRVRVRFLFVFFSSLLLLDFFPLVGGIGGGVLGVLHVSSSSTAVFWCLFRLFRSQSSPVQSSPVALDLGPFGSSGIMSTRLFVEFTGGLEAIFDNQKQTEQHVATESSQTPQEGVSMRTLLRHLGKQIKKPQDVQLMLAGDTVRPGVLVLVNETDWELTGGIDTMLNDGDCVAFVSTLHGG